MLFGLPGENGDELACAPYATVLIASLKMSINNSYTFHRLHYS